jgi:hypothetical protein
VKTTGQSTSAKRSSIGINLLANSFRASYCFLYLAHSNRSRVGDVDSPKSSSTSSGLLVLHRGRRIGGAIGLWPLSDRTAARLTNARIKEVALTGRMMRPFRKAPARHWYISGMVLRPELIGMHAIRVLLGDGLSHWIYTAAFTPRLATIHGMNPNRPTRPLRGS